MGGVCKELKLSYVCVSLVFVCFAEFQWREPMATNSRSSGMLASLVFWYNWNVKSRLRLAAEPRAETA